MKDPEKMREENSKEGRKSQSRKKSESTKKKRGERKDLGGNQKGKKEGGEGKSRGWGARKNRERMAGTKGREDTGKAVKREEEN